MAIFTSRGSTLAPRRTIACTCCATNALRAEFTVKLRQFLATPTSCFRARGATLRPRRKLLAELYSRAQAPLPR